MSDLREQLAAYAHDTWIGWMRWMMPKLSTRVPGGPDGESLEGPLVVPAHGSMEDWEPRWHHETLEHIQRWRRQMGTTYHELSEKEKESDRDEADKMLALFEQFAPVPREVEKLANFIAQVFPDEPGRCGDSESAVDVAIRLLKSYKAICDVCERGNDERG